MNVFFDTSVMVASVVDQLPNHESAFDCFLRYSGKSHRGHCSTHSLAECYATLTALPLPRRIQPFEARRLISENFETRLELVVADREAYASALKRVTDLGLVSGVIYDALHLACAESAGCKRLFTYNLADFQRLKPEGVVVSAP